MKTSVIALNGDEAPETGGAEFVGVFVEAVTNAPGTNVSGNVAFLGRFQTGDNGAGSTSGGGVWSTSGGALGLVARRGDEAPGASGAQFDYMTNLASLSAAGDVAFLGYLLEHEHGVDSTNDQGVWSTSDGALGLVARTGNEAPGTGGVAFRLIGAPVMNVSGDVAFTAYLQADVDNRGVWSTSGGALELIARQGFEAPGTGGANFRLFDRPRLNALGHVAFAGHLRKGEHGVDSTNDEGIWSTSGGALGLVARERAEAPGTGGLQFGNFFNNPSLNASGDVAFRGGLETGERGIWSTSGGVLGLVIRGGDEAPGTGGAVFNDGQPILNASGEVAFTGHLRIGENGVDATNDAGIWSTSDGVLELIAREGADAAGTGGADFDSFGNLCHNAPGDLVFYAFLQTGENGVEDHDDSIPSWREDTSTNNEGLWAYSSVLDGVLLIAREGDLFDVSLAQDGGDLRTISGIVNGSVRLNDAGQIVYALTFTDGASGVFATQIPSASSTCPWDINTSAGSEGNVDAADLAVLLNLWGAAGGCADLAAPLGVDASDLAGLLNAWGPCN